MGLSPSILASLTHCAHIRSGCTHSHKRTHTGCDSVHSDSSQDAALTSVDRTLCHALSPSACDCSRMRSAGQYQPSVSCVCTVCPVGDLSVLHCGCWLDSTGGAARHSALSLYKMHCALACLHGHIQTNQVTWICPYASMQHASSSLWKTSHQSLTLTALKGWLFFKVEWKAHLICPGFNSPWDSRHSPSFWSRHTACHGDAQSRFLWRGRWAAVKGRVANAIAHYVSAVEPLVLKWNFSCAASYMAATFGHCWQTAGEQEEGSKQRSTVHVSVRTLLSAYCLLFWCHPLFKSSRHS